MAFGPLQFPTPVADYGATSPEDGGGKLGSSPEAKAVEMLADVRGFGRRVGQGDRARK
jgi:hypothetical protein